MRNIQNEPKLVAGPSRSRMFRHGEETGAACALYWTKRASRRLYGQMIGLTRGVFRVPDSIDAINDQIEQLLLGTKP